MGDLDDRGSKIDGSGVEGSLIFGDHYAGLLDLLRTNTDTKYLARPRILTLNNQTAEIKITTDEAINVTTTINPETGLENVSYDREETGVSFKVTPQVSVPARNDVVGRNTVPEFKGFTLEHLHILHYQYSLGSTISPATADAAAVAGLPR